MKDNNFISLFNNLFIYRFQFYHKLRQRYRQTKDTNTSHEPSSFSSVRIILIEIQIFIFLFQILPISYNSLTPLTTTTTTNKSFFRILSTKDTILLYIRIITIKNCLSKLFIKNFTSKTTMSLS